MPTLKRDKLYEDVWSRPCTKIAAEIGISSSALKRICDGMNIPTPSTGYWTKIQFRKSVTKPPLPEASSETRLSWEINLNNSQTQKRAKKPEPSNRCKEEVPEVPIAKDLDHLHPLVKRTRSRLKNQWSRNYGENEKLGNYLNAQVSETSLDRTLLFLDALVRGLESQGFKIGSDTDDPKKPKALRHPYQQRQERLSSFCWVESSGERVGFRLREFQKRIPLTEEERKSWSFSDWKEVPSGQLVFAIEESSRFEVRKTWRDGKLQRIEKFLGEIVQCFASVGKEIRERRIQWEEQERHWTEINAVQNHHRNQRRREEELAENMLHLAKEHHKAEVMRQFISKCRSRMALFGEATPETLSRSDLWFRWMETRADMLDPIKAESMPWESRYFENVIGYSYPPPN